MDEITPPSTVFAAYNHYAGPHEIRVWPYNGHEAGELHQHAERIAFLEGLGLAPRMTVRRDTESAPIVVDIGAVRGHDVAFGGGDGGTAGRSLDLTRKHRRRGETCPIR